MATLQLTHYAPFKLQIPNATQNEAGEIVADLASVIDGDINADTLTLSGDAEVGGTLEVTGATTAAAISCTTLAASGAVTCATTLGVTGASTLAAVACTTLNASGLVAAAAAVTVGTTLGVTGASTLAAVGCTTLSTSGTVSMVLPTYADNAAALLGGLVATNLYKTATGEVRIVV